MGKRNTDIGNTAGKPGSKWEEPAHGGSWAQVLGRKHPEWGQSCSRKHSVAMREATAMGDGAGAHGSGSGGISPVPTFQRCGFARKGPQGFQPEENSQGKPGHDRAPGNSQSTSRGLLGQAGIFSHAIPFRCSTAGAKAAEQLQVFR